MPISVSVAPGFRDRMEAKARSVERRVQSAVVKYGVAVAADLIEQTPIRSGQARANWKIDINKRDDVFIELRDTIKLQSRKATANTAPDYFSTDDALLYATSQAQSYESGDIMYIYNNAPYIVRLNEGYSPQAPANYIQEIVAKNKEGLKIDLSTTTGTRSI